MPHSAHGAHGDASFILLVLFWTRCQNAIYRSCLDFGGSFHPTEVRANFTVKMNLVQILF